MYFQFSTTVATFFVIRILGSIKSKIFNYIKRRFLHNLEIS